MRRAACTLALIVTVLGATDPAAANTISPRLTLTAQFSTDRTASPSGYTLALGYGTGAGQPPGVRAVLIHAPTGTRFSPGRPGACTATDAEATSTQSAACPATSRVGAGTFTAFTGVAALDPVQGTTEVFRTPSGLLELARAGGSPLVIGTDRFSIDGSFLRATPPRLLGAGPRGTTTFGRLALTLYDPAFTTTPLDCPPDGKWITQVGVTFDDGTSETETAASPCRVALRAPRIRLAPRAVRRGRRAAVRIGLVGGSPACRRRAAVRIGGTRARTATSGRARLRVRLRRPTLVAARAAGCPRATARLGVRR